MGNPQRTPPFCYQAAAAVAFKNSLFCSILSRQKSKCRPAILNHPVSGEIPFRDNGRMEQNNANSYSSFSC